MAMTRLDAQSALLKAWDWAKAAVVAAYDIIAEHPWPSAVVAGLIAGFVFGRLL
jgi:ElaB/YqjD/DUF883 family membrane-anchored ribosome-binding protein